MNRIQLIQECTELKGQYDKVWSWHTKSSEDIKRLKKRLGIKVAAGKAKPASPVGHIDIMGIGGKHAVGAAGATFTGDGLCEAMYATGWLELIGDALMIKPGFWEVEIVRTGVSAMLAFLFVLVWKGAHQYD